LVLVNLFSMSYVMDINIDHPPYSAKQYLLALCIAQYNTGYLT